MRRRVYKKKARTTRKFRNTRRGYKKARTFRAKWLKPISQRKNVCFTYADTGFSVNIANMFGNMAYYVFRGNSTYDPDLTGVGVQPYGYDELMKDTMFVNYRVAASSIKVYFYPESIIGALRRIHCVVFPFRDDNPVISDLSDVRMIPYHKETTYDAQTENTRGCRNGGYMTTRRIYSEITPKDFNFSSTYNNNPTLGWFWIVLFKVDDDVDDVDIYFDVKIKYYTSVTRYGQPNES